MRHTTRWVSPILALLLVGAVLAADKKKDSDKVQTKEKMASSGKFVGTLTVVENSTKNFTVQVAYYEIDPAKYQSLEQYIAQQTMEISRLTTFVERRKRVVQYQLEVAKKKSDLYRKVTKDVKLRGEEDMEVRTMVLPINYDEKGKVKKYTRKELQELKGENKKLPGYTADWDGLHKDQVVRVYLAKQKKTKSKPRTKVKDKDKEEDKDLFDDDVPRAVMVVILKEPPPTKE